MDICALATEARIDILHHLFAPLVLEIDVDVGRLVAFGGDESLEQEIVLRRIDFRYAEAEADRRIGGGAASLRKNFPRAREAYDVVDGEEIGGVVQFGDELQLVQQERFDILRDSGWITLFRARESKGFERFLFAGVAFAQFARIFVSEVAELEREPFQEAHGLRDRFGRLREEPRHFLRALQMLFAVRIEEITGAIERRLFPDAGERVGERPSLRNMHMRVIDRDERQVLRARQFDPARESSAHVRPVENGRCDPEPASERVDEARGKGAVVHHDEMQAVAVLDEIVEKEGALPLFRA
jgi:hypothetical protein